MFFNRNRASLDYAMTSTSNLPQFGFTEAVSYNHPKLRGLAPVMVGQVFGSGFFPKAGIQLAYIKKEITLFSWLVSETRRDPTLDFFFLGRYTPRLTEKANLFCQMELLNAFPTSVPHLRGADLQPVLFPNPVTGSARVGFIAEQNGTAALEITDLSGRVLQHSEHSAMAGLNKIALNTAEITPGVYLLHLRLNEQSTVIRFIKQL